MLEDYDPNPRWYVVHTYAGYENRVAANIEKIVENRNMGNLIFDVKIPTETVVDPSAEEGAKGAEKETMLFPSYVLVKMIMNYETWYVVRNTRGATGFVGPESKPVALSDEEVKQLGVDTTVISLSYKVGDLVNITEGFLSGHTAVVKEISEDFKTIKVVVPMSNRETPVELSSSSVKKIQEK